MKHPVLAVVPLFVFTTFALAQAPTRVCINELKSFDSTPRDAALISARLSGLTTSSKLKIEAVDLASKSGKELAGEAKSNNCDYVLQLWRYWPQTTEAYQTGGPTQPNQPRIREQSQTLSYELKRLGQRRAIVKGTLIAPFAAPPDQGLAISQVTKSAAPNRAMPYDQLAAKIAAKIP